MYAEPTAMCALPAQAPNALDADPLLAPLRVLPNEPVTLGGVLLKGKIGEGGMAGVYLGWHTRLKFPVAVKILKDPSALNLPMFLREARLTVSVDHPNLVRVFDVNAEPRSGLHYIVMEYVDGCSAYELLQRQLKQQHKPLGQLTALEIALCSARALGAAHRQGIVHRDVKSDNILIRARDGTVKVADLGFADNWERSAADRQHRHSTVVGTTGFVSPEVLMGEPATPAADVYALGATLHELLTGYLPYGAPYDDGYYVRQLAGPAPDVRSLVPELDKDVANLVRRCLEHSSARRYADGNELAAALEEIIHRLAGTKFLEKIPPGDTEDDYRPVVLCVDDDEKVLELMKDILEGQGFQPVCFPDAVGALASLRDVKPDVAVLDLNMPGMNGLQLCQGLRQVDGYQELAVLIISGESTPDAVHDALEQGITDYLIKPVRSADLVVRVRLLSRLRAMNREKRVIETQLLRLKSARLAPTASAALATQA